METKDTAVIVFHGMGQQVPFETLGNVAKKTAQKAPWIKGDPNPNLEIQSVPKLGSDKPGAAISRARMTVSPKDGNGPTYSVDFFECYWAPITEGKIGILDVLSFLLKAGWAGMLHIVRGGFERQFWSGRHRFPLPKKNLLSLGMAVCLVASLIVLGICVLCVLGGHAVQHLGLVMGSKGFSGVIWGDFQNLFDRPFFKVMQGELLFLLRLMLVLLLPVLAFVSRKARGGARYAVVGALSFLLLHVAAFWASTLGQWWFDSRKTGYFTLAFGTGGVQAIFLALTSLAAITVAFRLRTAVAPTKLLWGNALLVAVALIAVSMCLLFSWWCHWGGNPAWPWEVFFTGSSMVHRTLPFGKFLLIVYGAAALGLFYLIRGFLIQYVGDVAAYISSHTVSKFADIRARIQEEAFGAACHVYASGYRKVIVIGHSLGSVIAYDALNGVINHDLIQKKGWKAAERTKLLLTFGSPLNKIAFIFRAQLEDNAIRESLAAAKQPLLEENHAYRPRYWVNVWSRNDIVSGPLEYFDFGDIAPVSGMTGPDRFAFTYKRREAAGSTAGIFGHVALEDPPRPGKLSPVIPLIDAKADIPLAAHTQFWENDLIYRVAVRAIEDEDDGHFEGLIRVDPA